MFLISTTSLQCTVNDVHRSGILLKLLLMTQWHRQFQFCVSGLAMFLVSCYTQCSLNQPTGRSLMVLSQEIRVDTPYFFFVLPLFQDFYFSHCKMQWTLVLEIPVSWEHCCMTSSDFVKTCDIVWNYQSFPYSHFALFHQSCTYHTIVQRYTCWWWYLKFISLSMHLIHNVHFPVAFKDLLTLLIHWLQFFHP
jgi:hypothetical protein